MAIKKNLGLAYYKEGANRAAPNFTNAAGNRLRLLRKVSEDLNTNISRDRSNEVRTDGQLSGSVITGASGGGTLNLQFSLDTYDDLLVGMLYAGDDAGAGREDGWLQGGFAALANILAAPATVQFQVADGSLNGSAVFTRAPAEGERIYVRGFGNKNLDTIWTVAAGATTSKVTLVNDTGMASIAEYAGIAADVSASVTVLPVKGYTRNATLERPFGFVRLYTDSELAGTASTTGLATVDWAVFRGCILTGIQLACAPGSAGWTGSFSALLADEVVITDATSAANVGGFQITNWDEVEVANANPLVNAIQSVLMVRLKKVGQAITTATRVDPQSFNVNVTNGATELQATRNRGAIAIIGPAVGATVTMALLYIDPTFHQAMLADDAYEIEIGVGDSEGRAQLWRFPKNRFTSTRPNPGVNQAVLQNLTFESEPGGQPFAYTGFTNGGATAARTVEICSFYARAV
jgi:hypothetical protein